MMWRSLLRYGAYPVVVGSAAGLVILVAAGMLPAWPVLPVVVGIGIAFAALLEAALPYEEEWRRDHGDFRSDLLHALVNLGSLAATAYVLHALRDSLPPARFWPTFWPAWAQVLLAGAIIDLGLYAMHRASHSIGWAWRLHAIHHAAERLYWLNGERRHPLSALLMAGPGLLVVIAIGAPPIVVAAWLTFLGVHLAFQHANADYRVGAIRRWLGVAEVHRWHHKREYEHAQVNFGEVFMIWDRLFGTYLDRPEAIGARDVGLREEAVPLPYLAQLRWPFLRDRSRRARLAAAFEQSIVEAATALERGDFQLGYERLERAHVLGQTHTIRHVRSHLAFLRWAIFAGDAREAIGQVLRVVAAALITWLWVPRGNTGGARVSAVQSMPVSPEIETLLREASQ